ncbi:Solute carrier family 22 member 6-B [Nymphon striatum]|nr:Solute carrier family 22 member 6-B [Nymphon striatum]
MNFEKILEEMKGIGRAQVILVLFAFWTHFIMQFNIYLQMFSQGDENYRCSIPECDESPAKYQTEWLHSAIPQKYDEKTEKYILDNCHMHSYNVTSKSNGTCDLNFFEKSTKVKCQTFIYASKYQTLTKEKINGIVIFSFTCEFDIVVLRIEWDLTCDKSSRLVLSMSIFMAGFLVGIYLFGIISDRLLEGLEEEDIIDKKESAGRSIPKLPYSNQVLINAPTPRTEMKPSRRNVSEFIGTHHRYLLGIPTTGTQTAELFLVALAYNVRDWKYLQIAASCLSLPCLLFFWIGIESPKWLISQKRYEDAKTAIKIFAKMQGKEVPESSLQIPEEEQVNNENEQKKLNPLDLFRTPELRFRMILISIIWFFDSLIYYSISLGVKEIPGSIYVNYSLLAAGDIIAVVTATFAIKYFRRVLCMSASMFSVTIFSFCQLAVAPDASMAIAGLAICGRFVTTITFIMTYVFTAELFPTPLRSSAFGTGSMFSRVGGIAAPYVATVIEVWRPLPVLILGSCGIIGGIVLLFLPETLNKPLPETVDEIEKSTTTQSLPAKLVHKLFSSSSRKEPPIVLKSVLKTI